jgi:hypothetical protein
VPALNNQFIGASWQACDAVLSIRITLIQIADSDADPAFFFTLMRIRIQILASK